MKYWLLRNHYLLVAGVLGFAAILFTVFYRSQSDWQILVTVVGGSVSLIYIIEKQQLEEARLFKELFTEFNARYDKLNNDLIRILDKKNERLSDADKGVLSDYFNLCGEEYLFYRNGYVYPEVWESWYNGMRTYADHPAIREHWAKELKSSSYYGFEIPAEAKPLPKKKEEPLNPSRGLYDNAGMPWTNADRKQLEEFFRRGLSVDEIAFEMKRTDGAIRSQMAKQKLIYPKPDHGY